MTDEELRQLFEASAAETRARFAELREEMNGRFAEVRGEFSEVRGAIRDEIAAVRGEISEVRGEMSAGFAEVRGEISDLHLHFDITAEGLRNDIRLVAEKVIQVDEKLDREAADIRAEMRSGFAETHALIQLSYGELDKRVRLLEK